MDTRRYFTLQGLLIALVLPLSAMVRPVAAEVDASAPQVTIESRLVEVSGEVLLNLGIGWNNISGHYSSTGKQEPASESSSDVFGRFGLGGNLWLNTGVGGMALGGPLSTGPVSAGAGASINGFFGSQNKFLTISRHHGASRKVDVTGSRELDGSLDFTARARVPIILNVAPRVATQERKPATIYLDLFVGPSIIRSETSLRSDQTFFDGTDKTSRNTSIDVGAILGLAVSKEITTAKVPLLGDIPVLGRLFYQARFAPGSKVSKNSTFGFKEKVSADPSTNHEIGVELVIILTPRIIRGN
jgi:hypothetical protein